MILQYGSCLGQTGHITLPDQREYSCSSEGWQKEGGQLSEPSVQGITHALPGGCAVSGICRSKLDLLAPLHGSGGCGHTCPVVLHCPIVLPFLCKNAEAAQPWLVLLLPRHVLKLADVQQDSNSSGKEELPSSRNSRDSYHALSELNRTTQIDLLHNDSKNC